MSGRQPAAESLSEAKIELSPYSGILYL